MAKRPTSKEAGAAPPIMADSEGVRLVDAPHIYASSFNLMLPGNDFAITLSRPKPAAVLVDGAHQVGVMLEPVAVLHLSVASVKDLSILLSDAVANYEREEGAIETEFSKRKVTEAAAAALKRKKK